jgi:serine/threonine-protein kinase RsbW
MPAQLTLTLASRPATVRQMRNVAAELAEAVRLPEEMVYDVRLAVSEAVTNAVRHGSVAGAAIVMEAISRPGRLQIIIRDGGPEAQAEINHGLGLGLPIMNAMASDVQIDRAAGGTVVTLTFHRPGH